MTAARLASLLSLAVFCALAVRADGPADNIPEKVRPIPPAGIGLKQEAAAALKDKLDELAKAIAALPAKLKGKPALLELMPDVEVLHKAVAWALEMNLFYDAADVAKAEKLLALGQERARLLAAGKTPWATETGLVVRGFRSRIDGSVQPYGLVVPQTYRADSAHRHRLDVWLHGRGEKSAELQFLDERSRSGGQFQPRDTFVVHPYGRYCNAFKFAGEIDILEAIDHVQKHYAIDEDRVVMRGFSMGGAGCWQMAVHYPDRWCASAPGAGFSETPEFLKSFQKETLAPSELEKKLWRMYDCDGYAENLFNLPTVAYSGEKDSQKQAADVMEAALKKEGIELVHVIGEGAGHSYTPKAMQEINRRIDRLAAKGRERVPARVRFTTYTLRYPRSHWVALDELAQHWEKASVDAALQDAGVAVKAKNVTALTLSFGPGDCPLAFGSRPAVTIAGQGVTGLPAARSDRSWSASFRFEDGAWKVGKPGAGLRKRPGLQGPIDDAFMDRFVFVRPTGQPANGKVGAWAKAEMERAIKEWKRHFRGDALVKDDIDVTDADIASANLILWGDPASNAVMGKVAGKLPIGWDGKNVTLGKSQKDAADHALILIHPNPLNPSRYVVLNSGFTYREYDYLNNARQVPKLPDWAVIDVTQAPDARYPGKVTAAGFFGEDWSLRAK